MKKKESIGNSCRYHMTEESDNEDDETVIVTHKLNWRSKSKHL